MRSPLRALLSTALAAGLALTGTALTVTAAPGAAAATALTWGTGDVMIASSNSGIPASWPPQQVRANDTSTRVSRATSTFYKAAVVDAAGTTYLLDISGGPTIRRITAAGVESDVRALGSTYNFPEGDLDLLPDGSLLAAVTTTLSGTRTDFLRVPLDGSSQTLIASSTFSTNVGVDAAGALYYSTNSGANRVIYKRTTDGTVSTVTTVGSTGTLTGILVDFAVDAAGTVYPVLNNNGVANIGRLAPQSDGTYSFGLLASQPSDGVRSSVGGIAVLPTGQVAWARYSGSGSYPAALHRTSATDTASTSDYTSYAYGDNSIPVKLAAYPGRAFTMPVNATVSGTVRAGELLQGSAGSVSPAPDSTTYAWKVGGTEVSTGPTYRARLVDAGKALTLTVTGAKSGYVSSTSTSTAQTVATSNGFTGTLKAGETLSAVDTAATSSWQRYSDAACTTAAGSAGSGSTFALPQAAAGQYVQLAQSVTGRSGTGSCVGPIAAAGVAPTISGAATASGVKGEELSYVPTLTGEPAPTVTVEGDLPDGVDVDATTGEISGTPTEAGEFPITLEATNLAGSDELTLTLTVQDVFTGLDPTVSGEPTVGQTLTASAGDVAPAPDDLDYQWQREDATAVGGWADVDGATGATYEATAADLDIALRVEVTATGAGVVERTERSAATEPVAAGTFTIGDPTITGSPQVGEELTCAAADGTPGTPDYAWSRPGTAGPVQLAGGATYTPEVDDLDAALTCSVTADRSGYDDASASATTAVVALGEADDYTVRITGRKGGEVRAGLVLRAEVQLDGDPVVPGTDDRQVTYQWLADGLPIRTKTRAAFRPGVERYGQEISVQVVVTRTGYERAEPAPSVAGTVSTQQPVFATDGRSVAAGSTLDFTIKRLRPGQAWRITGRGGDVLATGTSADGTVEDTLTVPRRYAAGQLNLRLAVVDPSWVVVEKVTVTRTR